MTQENFFSNQNKRNNNDNNNNLENIFSVDVLVLQGQGLLKYFYLIDLYAKVLLQVQ